MAVVFKGSGVNYYSANNPTSLPAADWTIACLALLTDLSGTGFTTPIGFGDTTSTTTKGASFYLAEASAVTNPGKWRVGATSGSGGQALSYTSSITMGNDMLNRWFWYFEQRRGSSLVLWRVAAQQPGYRDAGDYVVLASGSISSLSTITPSGSTPLWGIGVRPGSGGAGNTWNNGGMIAETFVISNYSLDEQSAILVGVKGSDWLARQGMPFTFRHKLLTQDATIPDLSENGNHLTKVGTTLTSQQEYDQLTRFFIAPWYVQTSGTFGELSGTTAGSTSTSGTLDGLGNMSSTSAGVATGSATLTGLGDMSASGTCSATGSGTLDGLGDMSATSAGVATGSATLTAVMEATGTAAGVAAASGTLDGLGDLSATGTGSATGSGTLDGLGGLSGSSTGASTTSATGQALLEGSGTSAGSSTGSGTLDGLGDLSTTIAGVSTTSGTLTGLGALAGTSAGSATATGTLDSGSSGSITGTSAGTSTAAGTLTATGNMASTVAGSSTGSATLTGIGDTSGTSTGLATTSASIDGAAELTAAVSGSSSASGSLDGLGDLTSIAAGLSTATAILTGLGDMTGLSAGTSTAEYVRVTLHGYITFELILLAQVGLELLNPNTARVEIREAQGILLSLLNPTSIELEFLEPSSIDLSLDI